MTRAEKKILRLAKLKGGRHYIEYGHCRDQTGFWRFGRIEYLAVSALESAGYLKILDEESEENWGITTIILRFRLI